MHTHVDKIETRNQPLVSLQIKENIIKENDIKQRINEKETQKTQQQRQRHQ